MVERTLGSTSLDLEMLTDFNIDSTLKERASTATAARAKKNFKTS